MNEHYTLEAPSLLRFLWSQRRRFSRGVSLAILRCVIIAPCPWLFQIIIDDHVKTGNVAVATMPIVNEAAVQTPATADVQDIDRHRLRVELLSIRDLLTV